MIYLKKESNKKTAESRKAYCDGRRHHHYERYKTELFRLGYQERELGNSSQCLR